MNTMTKLLTAAGRWLGLIGRALWTWPVGRGGWARRTRFVGQPYVAPVAPLATPPSYIVLDAGAHRIGLEASSLTQIDTIVVERVVYLDNTPLTVALWRALSAALWNKHASMWAIIVVVVVGAFALR